MSLTARSIASTGPRCAPAMPANESDMSRALALATAECLAVLNKVSFLSVQGFSAARAGPVPPASQSPRAQRRERHHCEPPADSGTAFDGRCAREHRVACLRHRKTCPIVQPPGTRRATPYCHTRGGRRRMAESTSGSSARAAAVTARQVRGANRPPGTGPRSCAEAMRDRDRLARARATRSCSRSLRARRAA